MPTEQWQLVRPAERLSGGLGSWWVQTGGVCGPQGTASLPGFGFTLLASAEAT